VFRSALPRGSDSRGRQRHRQFLRFDPRSREGATARFLRKI